MLNKLPHVAGTIVHSVDKATNDGSLNLERELDNELQGEHCKELLI